MNAETFLENFPCVTKAPNGVATLRDLILEFAVRGQLVSQDGKDEPASELLKSINVERAKAIKAGDIKQESLPPVEDDAPFHLPNSWLWTRLGNTGRIFNGNSVSESGKTELAKVAKGLPYIATKDVGYGSEALAYENGLKVRFGDPEFKVAHANAVLICAEGGSAGRKLGITDRDICFGNKLYANEVWDGISHRWIFYVYQSPTFYKEFFARMKGIIGGISRSEFHLLPIPIPPVNEQRRIVAKVDELMALCDRLETQQQEGRKLFPLLSQASHDRLVIAPAAANLDRIFEEIGTISPADLHKTILNLAVRGQIKSSSKADWQEYKMRNLASLITSGSRGWAQFYANDGPLFLRAQNVRRDGSLLLEDVAHVRLPHKNEGSRTRVQKDDLLVVITGAGVTQATWVKQDLGEAYVSQHVALIRLKEPAFAPWLNLQLHATAGCFGQLQELIYGAKPGLNLDNLRELKLSIPPLAEQRRIVAKVDQLMALVETLKKQHQERDRLAELFAQAVVATLTGTQSAEKPKMKAPKTELISNLKLGKKPKPKDAAPLAALLIKANGEIPAKSLWQQSRLSIDAFYQQLKIELAHGWIAPPQEAVMQDVEEPSNGGGTTAHRLLSE